MPSRWTLAVLLGTLGISTLSLAACGPSSEEVDRRVDERISAALTAVPTPTPYPTATPQPTPTPIDRQDIVDESVAEALTALPTPTPQPTPVPPVDFESIYDDVARSVFFVETPRRAGSGWLVEPGLILTNEHVVEGYDRVTIRQASDPSFRADVHGSDDQHDIALLSFDPEDVPLQTDAEPLPLGDIDFDHVARPLIALGYSGASVKTDGTVGAPGANQGVLSQITDFGEDSYGVNLQVDIPIDPGDSGGPIMDSDGLAVGMSRAVQVATDSGQRVVGTFFAVHVDELRTALPELKDD